MDLIPDFGRHAIYIWSCYGLTALVFIGFTTHTFLRARGRRK